MGLLILGLVLWIALHVLHRASPGLYGGLTERIGAGPRRGVIALGLLVAVVLMIIGYRAAPVIDVYPPLPFGGHINNLLMLIAFFMFFSGSVGGFLAKRMRHPMLIGTKIWALAHLLVNGDLASVILFGGMLGWAVWQVILINKSGAWEKTPAKPGLRDAILVVVALVLFAFAAWLHGYLGHSVFQGSYA